MIKKFYESYEFYESAFYASRSLFVLDPDLSGLVGIMNFTNSCLKLLSNMLNFSTIRIILFLIFLNFLLIPLSFRERGRGARFYSFLLLSKLGFIINLKYQLNSYYKALQGHIFELYFTTICY